MWRSPVVTSAAAAEPLTLTQVKDHLRVDHDDQDTLITALLASMREHVEAYTATRMVTQTLTLRCEEWADLDALTIGPVQSITSIVYVDTDGANQTLSTDVYEGQLQGLEPRIVLKYGQTYPTIREGSLITVVAVVGYGVAGTQPEGVLHAIKMLIEEGYDGIDRRATVDALLCNHRL